MSSSLRYEPWSVHRELLNGINKVFEGAGSADGSSGATADWVPPVDVEEYADKFIISADVPGIDPNAIEITLENGVLILSGSREQRAKEGTPEGRRIERASGRFFRRFNLPDTADGDAVSARGTHGVLEIVIPKRKAAQPKRITISQ